MCRILLICLHEYENSVVERFELPWSCQIAHFISVWINLETTAKEKDRKIIEVDKKISHFFIHGHTDRRYITFLDYNSLIK